MDVMAKTIAVPRENRPMRIPSFPALERTAVLGFTDTKTLAVSGGSKGYGFIVRDPVAPLWYQQAPHGSSWSIAEWFDFDGTTRGITPDFTTEIIVEQGTISSYDIDGVTSLLGMSCTPLFRREGRLFHAMMAGAAAVELQFTTVITSAVLFAEFEVINASMELDCIVEKWSAVVSPSGLQCGYKKTLPSGTVGFRLKTLQVNVLTASPAAILTRVHWGQVVPGPNPTVAPGVGTPLTVPSGTVTHVLVPVVGPVEADTVTTPWLNTRCNAAAVLFSNVTSVLNKEGTVNAARLQLEAFSLFQPGIWESAMAKVHPKDRYYGPLENGLYTFTLPEAGSEKFRDCLDTPAWVNVLRPVVVELDSLAYANLFVFSDLDGAAASTLAVTLDRHIEFRATSVIFPLGVSTAALETYHGSQVALVNQGVFYENPVHLSAIAGLIGKAVSSVAPIVAPYARQAAVAVGKAALGYGMKKFGQMAQAGFTKPRQPQPKKAQPAGKKTVARRARR